jgi:hypothetical protein
VSFGKVDLVPIWQIFKPEIIQLLKREIDYLRQLGQSQRRYLVNGKVD